MLLHHDLCLRNILVDNNGNVTSVVDWEIVSALQVWKACSYPSFLEGRRRDDKPNQTNYLRDEKGEVDRIYWDFLMEYELTKLRRYFLDEMRRLEPEWIDVFDSTTVQEDFYLAAQHCDSELHARIINKWLGEVTEGKGIVLSLDVRINQY